MLLKFKKYLNDNWDAREFCHLLALEARSKILSEMALGQQNVSKMAILYDKDDYRFLSQFPPAVWKQALTWRYNEGIRMLMRLQNKPDDLPEGYDWLDSISFEAPGKGNKHWVFGTPGGKPNIYIGLSELIHKLSDKPKTRPGESHAYYKHWPGDEGPSLKEIDPNLHDIDPNQLTKDAAHPKNYRHGIYDFDLSGLVEIAPEDIESMSDYEILPLLPQSKFGHLDLNDPKVVKSPEVQAGIAKIKEAMKKEPKHTFSGFSVLQPSGAQESLKDWVLANGMEDRLFGEHPTSHHDEWDNNKEKAVDYVSPQEVFPDKKVQWDPGFKIPTVDRRISFTEIDEKKNTEEAKVENVHMPVLNPVKTIPTLRMLPPGLNFTNKQKAILASRSTYKDPETGKRVPYHWNPDEETFDQAKKRYQGKGNFDLATKGEDLSKVLANWDILYPEQKAWLKEHTRNVYHQAQRYHSQKEFGDPHADPKNKSFYTAGYIPNYSTPERWALTVPPDQMVDFIKTYKSEMLKEILGSKKGLPGEESKGPLDWYIQSLKNKGVPQQSIIALEDRMDQVAVYIAYMLITWLNSPRLGIKDQNFGLLDDISWDDYDKEGNQRRRMALVRNYVASLAQQASAGALSRRQQEKYGISHVGSLDVPVGDTGKTMAGQVEKTGLGEGAKKIDTSAVRRWLHRGLHSIIPGAHKTHELLAQYKQFPELGIFLSAKRNYVAHVLRGGEAMVEKDLGNAEKDILTAQEESKALFDKYNEELKTKIPDEKAREEEIIKLIKKELPQLLQTKHPETFGKMAAKSPGFENIMTTAINNSIAMSKAHSEKGEMASKTKKAMETFFDELMTKESARRPIFDPSTESFKEGPQFSLSEFPTKPEEVIDIVRAFFTKEFEFLANIWLKNNGAKLYGNILALHDMDKGEEEDEKEFNDALAKKAIEPTPAAPAAPAPPTPMAQPAPAPALAAAKPVEDLLGKAGDFNSPKQGLDLMNAILAKSDAIKADKSLAAKLDNAVKVIAQRWGQLQQFHKLTQEDWQLFSMAKRNLTKLIGEVS